jgi:hypothetical protein
MLFSGCQKESALLDNEGSKTHTAVIWAKKHLPETTYSNLNWQEIQPINQKGNLIGWVVKPIGREKDKIEAYFIKAEKALPVEIIYNQINLKNKIIRNESSSLSQIPSFHDYETLELKQKAILSKKEKFSIISLAADHSNGETGSSRSRITKKAKGCWGCPTLPDVVVYGKKKRKPVLVNMSAFDPDNYDVDLVYVPIDDQGGGGGGSGGGSGDLEGGGGAVDDDYENIDMSQFTSWDVVQGVYLYTNEYYPYQSLGFPWKWWANPELKDENGYLFTRKAAILDGFNTDDFFLKDCKEVEAIIKFGPMFQQVAQFKAPQSVKDRLNWVRTKAPNLIIDNFNFQQLEEARGPVVNCDFFPLKIDKLPTGMNAAQFLDYFRLNINSFITLTGIGATKFSPYKDGLFDDSQQWLKSGPQSLGATVHIDMANDGSVILSDYSNMVNTDGSQTHSFTFSTLETPFDLEHPVAGNRKFGIYSNPSNPNAFTFYTMGVDRTWDGWFKMLNLNNYGFEQADKLWLNIQENLIKFINAMGGVASTFSQKSHISRPDY